MRFLLDAMLGKLATYLRMCGHDAAYALDRDVEADERLCELAAEEGRVLLTRDADLAVRADDSILLTERDVADQLRELDAVGIDLTLAERPARCGSCNGRIDRVAGDEPTPEYAPDPVATPVWRCRACGQHFWKGSHWADVRGRLAEIRE